MRIIPDHCKECTWFFSKMGACPNPLTSIFFSYISLIPYFIIFYLVTLTLICRKVSLIRLTSMLVFAYIIGDKLLKNIFRSIFYDYFKVSAHYFLVRTLMACQAHTWLLLQQ